MTNEDIAADIISFIRQKSIGDALVSKDSFCDYEDKDITSGIKQGTA